MLGSYDYSIVFTSLFLICGNFGNCCFILITGYFMIRKKMNWRRIFLLILAIYFYYWATILIFKGFHIGIVPSGQIWRGIAPFLFGKNWFVSCYLFFCLLIPYINKFLLVLSQKQFQRYLILIFCMGILLPQLHIQTYINAGGIILFVIMYSFGAYFQLYGISGKYFANKTIWNNLIFCNLLLFFIGTNIIGILKGKPTDIQLFSSLLAIAVFIRVLLQPPFINRVVNQLAKCVLGVYLIHDNDLVRQFLWNHWLPNASFLHTEWIFPIFLMKVSIVFIACILIEQLRLIFFEKIVLKYISIHETYFRKKIHSMLQKLNVF